MLGDLVLYALEVAIRGDEGLDFGALAGQIGDLVVVAALGSLGHQPFQLTIAALDRLQVLEHRGYGLVNSVIRPLYPCRRRPSTAARPAASPPQPPVRRGAAGPSRLPAARAASPRREVARVDRLQVGPAPALPRRQQVARARALAAETAVVVAHGR